MIQDKIQLQNEHCILTKMKYDIGETTQFGHHTREKCCTLYACSIVFKINCTQPYVGVPRLWSISIIIWFSAIDTGFSYVIIVNKSGAAIQLLDILQKYLVFLSYVK